MKRLTFTSNRQVTAALAEAHDVVKSGGVLLIPTESYYGLGADVFCEASIARICTMKHRARELGLPVLCADWQQLVELVDVPDRFRVKLSRIWPAPLTAILPARRETAAARAGTLAVRIPGHDALRALIYRTGPLTGTSANRHGRPACTETDEALGSLVEAPDLVLDAGPTPGGEPSTLVDLTGVEPRLLRPGKMLWEDPSPVP